MSIQTFSIIHWYPIHSTKLRLSSFEKWYRYNKIITILKEKRFDNKEVIPVCERTAKIMKQIESEEASVNFFKIMISRLKLKDGIELMPPYSSICAIPIL